MLSIYFFHYDKISLGKSLGRMCLLYYLGMTSLHVASRKGLQPVVELLLDRGANIDQKDKYGEIILSIYICIYHTINLPFH